MRSAHPPRRTRLRSVATEEVAAVQYVMAAIGVTAITALLWKAFGPQRPATRSALAPDDDPEFLRGLNRKSPEPGDEH